MSTAATQQPPAIPPRPSKSQERDHLQPQSAVPQVPARPVKRGVSPNPDRYAPSPLNGGIPYKKDRSNSNEDPIDRSKSVDIPHVVGEEGMEYAALADQPSSHEPSTSPEQTRTVGENMQIHAPKATMPAQSAKQRIMQVTRTDSDKAASFGIGKPSGEVPTPSTRSLKKKASTASGLSHSEAEDEERGIPEIGQHVPLLAYAGDVQAPSPAPGAHGSLDQSKAHHKRKSSSRGLPPGSYGLHGHNVIPEDKLEKEYYKKHPELLKLEHHVYQHDRPTDFSMSREQLNKMVRETEINGHGVATGDQAGTPSEQAGWAAYTEVASRPHSTRPQDGGSHQGRESGSGGDVIVIDEPNRNRRSVLFSDEAIPAPPQDEPESDYRAPILAEDEVRKNTPRPDQVPAVELPRERRGSDYDSEPPRSRPTSRPTSLYKVDSSEMRSTPLEDVIEYEPLFPDDDEETSKHNLTAAQIKEMKQRFPSQDIWEDAPSSVHYTAEVSTPELPEEEHIKKVPSRDETETPAQAFARRQEELAEKELTHPDAFLWRNQKPTWIGHQPHLAHEAARPDMAKRFPSRDVWEDTPDSLQLETTVSGPQMEQSSPLDTKPPVPERPQRKTTDPKDKPVVPDRPKPQIPARPAKASADGQAPKAKPVVPARPAGSKIAALQAGFMADLNKKLGLGPQAPKHEEEAQEESSKPEEPKEKAPLSDARKGRARGPQRRAPAPAAAPAPQPEARKQKLAFSTTVTIWSVDPEAEGGALVGEDGGEGQDSNTVKAAAGDLVEPEKEGAHDVTKVEEEAPSEKLAPVVDPAVEGDKPKTTEDAAEAVKQDDEDGQESHLTEVKTKTMATNAAGEIVAEATLEEDKSASKVEPKEVDVDTVKD